MSNLGDNDEEEAEKQTAAREPKVKRGAQLGRRNEKDAKPLISIAELAPGLRADEIIGAEVRSSDDKIVGEVRNIVFGTKDRRDYAIVASGGSDAESPILYGLNSQTTPARTFQPKDKKRLPGLL